MNNFHFIFGKFLFFFIILIFTGCSHVINSHNKELFKNDLEPIRKEETALTTITKKNVKTDNKCTKNYQVLENTSGNGEKGKFVNHELKIVRSKFIFNGKKITYCDNEKLPIKYENLPNYKQIALIFSFNGDLSVDNIDITGNRGYYKVNSHKYISLTKSSTIENQYLLIASPICEKYWKGDKQKFNIIVPIEGEFQIKVKYDEQIFLKNFFINKHELDTTFNDTIYYQAKKALKERGYKIKNIDMDKDDNLTNTLMTFQKDNNLVVNGILNSSTRKALGLPIGWKTRISNVKVLDAKIFNTHKRISCKSSNIFIPDSNSSPNETVLLVKYQLEFISVYNEFIGNQPIQLTTTFISQTNEKFKAIAVQDIFPMVEKGCTDCIATTIEPGHRRLTLSSEMETMCALRNKSLILIKPPAGKYLLTVKLLSDEFSEKQVEFNVPFNIVY